MEEEKEGKVVGGTKVMVQMVRVAVAAVQVVLEKWAVPAEMMAAVEMADGRDAWKQRGW